MFSRRQIFSFFGSGGLALAFPALATASLLATARSHLLPGLWGVFGDTDIESEILIEPAGLLVKAWRGSRELAFYISEQKIRDGEYKADFCRSLYALRDCMERAA